MTFLCIVFKDRRCRFAQLVCAVLATTLTSIAPHPQTVNPLFASFQLVNSTMYFPVIITPFYPCFPRKTGSNCRFLSFSELKVSYPAPSLSQPSPGQELSPRFILNIYLTYHFVTFMLTNRFHMIIIQASIKIKPVNKSSSM